MICDATLIFQLSTARSALPVQGASVLVTDPITGRNTRLTTDQSGRTHVLCVTAPPLSWSQSPGNDGRPYSIYHADIRVEGYVPVRLTGIQVFAGQQSLQTVEMIPCEGGKSMTNTPEETIGEPGDPLKSEQPGRFAQSPQEDDQPPGSLQGAEPGRRPGGKAADTGCARVPAFGGRPAAPKPAPCTDQKRSSPARLPGPGNKTSFIQPHSGWRFAGQGSPACSGDKCRPHQRSTPPVPPWPQVRHDRPRSPFR